MMVEIAIIFFIISAEKHKTLSMFLHMLILKKLIYRFAYFLFACRICTVIFNMFINKYFIRLFKKKSKLNLYCMRIQHAHVMSAYLYLYQLETRPIRQKSLTMLTSFDSVPCDSNTVIYIFKYPQML